MRRAVLAEPDRVVGEHEDRRKRHQRRQPYRPAHVVTEREERGPVTPQVMERHAVDDRPHRVLADTEVEVPALVRVRLDAARVGDQRERRRRQIRRAADQLGHVGRRPLKHGLRRLPRRGHRARGVEPRHLPVPALGEPAGNDPLELLRQLGVRLAVGVEPLTPVPARTRCHVRCSGGSARAPPAGTKNGSSDGQPMCSLVSRTSSSPSGEPCAPAVSCLCGLPWAMWVRTMISDGLSSTAIAFRSACSGCRARCSPRGPARASHRPRSACRHPR